MDEQTKKTARLRRRPKPAEEAKAEQATAEVKAVHTPVAKPMEKAVRVVEKRELQKPEAPKKAPKEDIDFSAMLEEFGTEQKKIRRGDRIHAKLMRVAGENVFFELGVGQDGWMSRAEIMDDDGELTMQIGDSIDVFVIRGGDSIQLSRKLGGDSVSLEALEDAMAQGVPVEGKVSGHNKGGLEVKVGGVRAFCPLGQVELGYCEDPAQYVGQIMQFAVEGVSKRDVLLSRRKLLQKERAEKAAATMELLKVGAVMEGVVRKVEKFGAFIDLGGIDALLPVSEIGWGVREVSDVLKNGDHVRAEVMRIEDDPKRPGQLRISLSRKSLQEDPFDKNSSLIRAGNTLEGMVTRTTDFGAFVELFGGVEGLVHISEMAYDRVRHPDDVVTKGQAVTVRVLSVDAESRRISLSLKDPKEAPQSKTAHIQSGTKVTGVVSRHESYGVFVELKEFEGVRALLPASETGTERGTDLRRKFPIGQELELTIIEVDDRGRVRVSSIARERQEERELVAGYQSESSSGFGTFADLLKAQLK